MNEQEKFLRRAYLSIRIAAQEAEMRDLRNLLSTAFANVREPSEQIDTWRNQIAHRCSGLAVGINTMKKSLAELDEDG